jgi:hypothetical protein
MWIDIGLLNMERAFGDEDEFGWMQFAYGVSWFILGIVLDDLFSGSCDGIDLTEFLPDLQSGGVPGVSMAAGPGKRGGPAHQKMVSKAQAAMQARQWTHVSGGALPEKAVKTSTGRVFPDLVFAKNGKTIAIQVGKKTKGVRGPVRPVSREGWNIQRLRGSGEFSHVFFLSYD